MKQAIILQEQDALAGSRVECIWNTTHSLKRKQVPTGWWKNVLLERELRKSDFDRLIVPLSAEPRITFLHHFAERVWFYLDRTLAKPPRLHNPQGFLVPHSSLVSVIEQWSGPHPTVVETLHPTQLGNSSQPLPVFEADKTIAYCEADRWSQQGLRTVIWAMFILRFGWPKLQLLIHATPEVQKEAARFARQMGCGHSVTFLPAPLSASALLEVDQYWVTDVASSITGNLLGWLPTGKPTFAMQGSLATFLDQEITNVPPGQPLEWAQAIYQLRPPITNWARLSLAA